MNTQTKHYKQLTQDKRHPFQALLQNDFSQTAIVVTLGVSKSTVSRELRSNSDPIVYSRKLRKNVKQNEKSMLEREKKQMPNIVTLSRKACYLVGHQKISVAR
ncbi:hypothetical protein CI610_00698 [invertebrate metagenome]|uniref:Transposase IS30-like HTH domain-containing protein n=1 Tax=invertebrate metagenome TaxID=1711999 RepID=A0A2H9TAV6_9ZZZZ